MFGYQFKFIEVLVNITLVGTYIFKKIVSPGEIHQILAIAFSSPRIGIPSEKILEGEEQFSTLIF